MMKSRTEQKLTVEHLLKLSPRILSDSMTIRPAMMALVVAIAGIMLPAIAAYVHTHTYRKNTAAQ